MVVLLPAGYSGRPGISACRPYNRHSDYIIAIISQSEKNRAGIGIINTKCGKVTRYDADGKPAFLSGIVFDITEKKATQVELEEKNKLLAKMSELDGLTRISNHRALVERLKSETERSDQKQTPLAIAIFDIDNFKQVNDSKGHIIGDEVLVHVAAVIRSNIRDTDLAGRYGGEEFLVIFPETDIRGAGLTAERIRQAIAAFPFGETLSISVSGGVQDYRGQSTTELIHEADMKMYQEIAK